MKDSAKKTLLSLAQSAVKAAVKGEPPPCSVDSGELQGKLGAFVTLKTHGRLRGCIGRFVPDEPLWKTVADMAVEAATGDPRFFSDRITTDELDEVEIEISILSPLKKTDDPLNEIEIGKHGIYITDGTRSGCFLPQVAVETGWTAQQFLENCCAHKAGLPREAWEKAPDTEVYLFTAEIIRGSASEGIR